MNCIALDDGFAALAPVPTRRSSAGACIPRHDPIDVAVPARLGALEWLVVAIARRDRFSSLRRPGRLSTALRSVFGSPNPMLADERLEALRRMAV